MNGGGAVGQLGRLLALIPWLLTRPGVSVAEAAAEFDVTEEQLRADLELAFMCGLPGHLPDDLIDVSLEGDRIVVTNADTIARPLRFAPDEAVALLVGLRALSDLPTPAGNDALDRVLAKLERAAGDAADTHRNVTVKIQSAVDADAAARDAIGKALGDGRRIRLEYYVPARDEVTVRDVDPVRLLLVEGHGYVEGWCHLAEDWRLFRLDRVQSVNVLDTPVDAHESPADRETAFDAEAATWRVRLMLEPRAAWLLEAFPCEAVQREPDLVVDMPVGDLGWARQLLLQLGGSARPLEPPELIDAVRAEAEAALAAYPDR
ncbi:MAG TPA: WYL domain-containing protein [Actinomycetes bacterium]|nr:WYL domain-containing protein [Actinomycetes bacterium]